jgi:hypothetical protein
MSTAFVFDELADDPKMIARPVELLRDPRGVYGIGVSKEFAPLARRERLTQSLILLRPDRFDLAKPDGAVLQKIGFRRGMFKHTSEEQLRRFIHHVALDRAGLPWPWRLTSDDPEWWSHDKKQQARNRGIYHGLRLFSLQIINNLIGKAHEEAADADAIKAARRFAFGHRENIYRACARSRRALQLADTFPILALMIYSEGGSPGGPLFDWKGRIGKLVRKRRPIWLSAARGCVMWQRRWTFRWLCAALSRARRTW